MRGGSGDLYWHIAGEVQQIPDEATKSGWAGAPLAKVENPGMDVHKRTEARANQKAKGAFFIKT